MSNDKDSRYKESDAVPIDPEGEQRELEAAGWERVDVQGKIFWLNPESGRRYPQGPAIRRLRQQRHEDAERERDEARTNGTQSIRNPGGRLGAGRTEQGRQLVESRQRLLLLAGDGLENVGTLRSQVLRERCGITGNRNLGTGLALGVVLGIVLGLMMNNVGYGIVIGVAVDIVIGVGLNNRGGGSRT